MRFSFIETGTVFIKDGRTWHLPDKRVQSQMAHRSGMSYPGRAPEFRLTTPTGEPLPAEARYSPSFHNPRCADCGSRLICNGCADCGGCGA